MKTKIIAGLIVVAVVISGFLFFGVRDDSEANEIIFSVESGKFTIDITTTGELEAKNSIEVLGPSRLREFRIYNVTIQDIVDEGTVVSKGEWIANLDKSDFQSKLQDEEIDLEQKQSQHLQTQLDTTLQMRQARDDLINLEYGVEEMKIKLEQSQFEPPATIKQAEIDLDKARRAFQQALDNYSIKLEQNKAKMHEIAAELRKVEKDYQQMKALEEQFIVLAPEDGMVVYAKGWDGKQIKAGSQVSSWRPVVATLPDLTTMMSKTYINEVDVRRIKVGQVVEIGLDAFPDKKLNGKVIRVANVGEQRPNSDSKVFEATIEIEGSDEMLKPAMTTSNRIIVKEIDSVLHVPLEALHSVYDSITFVYKREKLNTVKQEVQIGETNSDEAIILNGLNADDRVYLSIPGDMENKKISLLPEMDGLRMQKRNKNEDKSSEKTQTITLPDGTTKTVTEEEMKKFREGRSNSGQGDKGGGQTGSNGPNS